MRVVLSTIGKFHTFDLARQLHAQGALRTIFSAYPRLKLRSERLPSKRVRTFPWLHAPLMKLGPLNEKLKRAWEWQDRIRFDRHVAHHLPACDLFCGLSSSGLQTGRIAKTRAAKYVCDRGSSHIRYQDNLLRDEHDRQGIPFAGIDPRVIAYEEAEYDLADAITVPSTFALGSFVQSGIRADKLRLAPYGVDLSKFFPVARPNDQEFSVLFVGSVSVRKGIVYLLEAFRRLRHDRKRLTIAGPIDSNTEKFLAPIRTDVSVRVLGHVPQEQLRWLMSSSHVMVLPSIEEGLALVQAQAMACGCPVIASDNTGASDLFTDGVEGFITRIRDVDAIAQRLQLLADDPDLRTRMGAAALKRVNSIGGWNEYGDTICKIFEELVLS